MIDTMQMNTINDSSTTGIGARLKAAREALQMSQKDAAARLHLSVKYINIMENEDFHNDTPVTFLRGYLRSYGRILNIPDQEISEALDQLGMHTPTPKSFTPRLSIPVARNNEKYVKGFSYLVGLGLLVLAGIWWSSHNKESDIKNSPNTESSNSTIRQLDMTEPSTLPEPSPNLNHHDFTSTTTPETLPTTSQAIPVSGLQPNRPTNQPQAMSQPGQAIQENGMQPNHPINQPQNVGQPGQRVIPRNQQPLLNQQNGIRTPNTGNPINSIQGNKNAAPAQNQPNRLNAVSPNPSNPVNNNRIITNPPVNTSNQANGEVTPSQQIRNHNAAGNQAAQSEDDEAFDDEDAPSKPIRRGQTTPMQMVVPEPGLETEDF